MPKNQSDSQEIGEYHPEFAPEAYEEEMETLEANREAIEKGFDLKKLMEQAVEQRPKK